MKRRRGVVDDALVVAVAAILFLAVAALTTTTTSSSSSSWWWQLRAVDGYVVVGNRNGRLRRRTTSPSSSFPAKRRPAPVPARSRAATFLAMAPRKKAAGKTDSSKQKKKNRSSSAGGGFGGGSIAAKAADSSGKSGSSNNVIVRNGNKHDNIAANNNNNNNNDGEDYAVFPRLEPNVVRTLVPADDQLAKEEDGVGSAGDRNLPDEVYHRLDQIYGFPRFNYDYSVERGRDERNRKSDGGGGGDEVSAGTIAGSSTMGDALLLSNDSPSPSSSTTLDELLSPHSSSSSSSSSARSSSNNSIDNRLSLDGLPPFSKFRVLHVDPLVLSIDDFFTEQECDRYVSMLSDDKTRRDSMQSRSPTVGKDSAAKAQRTSTTWYNHYKNVPELVAKASRLLGLDAIDRWEEPQTVRYRRNEKFTWHLDALGPSENRYHLGGQRLATLLVYLTSLDESEGGATIFRDLGTGGAPLRVQPRKGSALLFFPAGKCSASARASDRTVFTVCGNLQTQSSRNESNLNNNAQSALQNHSLRGLFFYYESCV